MSAAVDDVTVVYTAGTFVTMEPGYPEVESVAVRDGRIAAVGSLAEVTAALGDSPVDIDDRFAGRIVMPGFIDQHLHPILGASTLATEVISTESWRLPDRSFPAAASPEAYRRRLEQGDTSGKWVGRLQATRQIDDDLADVLELAGAEHLSMAGNDLLNERGTAARHADNQDGNLAR